jgi:hypothetical protein
MSPPLSPYWMRRPAALVALVVAATALLVASVLFLGPGTEREALARLSVVERRALYERTFRTLESSCDPERRPRGLDDFCQEQAEFLKRFPECVAACDALAAKFEPLPSR